MCTRTLPLSSQGNSIGLVRGAHRWGCDVNLFWNEANDLRHNSLAVSTAEDLTVSRGDPPVQPVGVWRWLGNSQGVSPDDVSWIPRQASAACGTGVTGGCDGVEVMTMRDKHQKRAP